MQAPEFRLLAASWSRLALAAGCLAFAAAASAPAAATDIANAPLFTSSSASVRPNMMFILDDSGSMAWDYLPDSAGDFDFTQYGRRAAQCNGVAYNPSITYSLPVDYLGLTAAAPAKTMLDPSSSNSGTSGTRRDLNTISSGNWPSSGSTVTVSVDENSRQSNWYSTNNGSSSNLVTVYGDASHFFTGIVTAWSASTGNLSIKVLAVVGTGSLSNGRVAYGLANTYFTYTGSEKKLGFTYTSTGSNDSSTTFYRQCNSNIGDTPGSSVFTAAAVGSGATQAQNYANWWTYYRTRIDMMKTSMSLAFKTVDSRYRVGYSTISTYSAEEGTNFLSIRDFDATQKQKFYAKLNAANPVSSTPLRGALAKAGQYFAKKAYGQAADDDPIQYSCQRNFTILSTDGYWNTGWERTSFPKYGPYQLDNNTRVGQQDGGATLRPMFDGGTVTATTTEKWNRTVVTTTRTQTPKVTTTTVTTSTTTQTPVSSTAGQKQTAFVLVPEFNASGGSISHSGRTVTVTAPGHGLVTGDIIDVGSGNNNDYQAGNATVTVLSDSQFTYTLSSNPSGSPSGTYNFRPGGVNCNNNKAVQRQVVQVRDSVRLSTTNESDVTTQAIIATFTTTKTDITPFTRVVKVVNGVTVSDTTTTGAVNSQSQDSSTTTTSDSPVTVHKANTPAPTSTTGTSDWVITSQGAAGSSCLSSPSGASGITSNLPSTTSTTTTTNTTTTGPTTQNGTPVVTVTGSTTTDSTKTTTTDSATSGGSTDTLADVAMYYYQTDLRDTSRSNCTGALGADICTNNVPGSTGDAAHSYGDSATWQHMTTFTLGLGASGMLAYDASYLSQLSGDFFDVTNNGKNWPTPQETDNGGVPQNIDDLWHAAVNGRGQYFSAADPSSLTTSLNAALDKIKAVTGAASAASTSSLQPVTGDNDIFVAQFTTQSWTGDVLAFTIDPDTGGISSTPTWSAQTRLEFQTAASRVIYYPDPAGAAALRPFTFSNLTTDGYGALFTNFCSKPGANGGTAPAQCSDSGFDTASANTGANLVNYLRGDKTQAYYRVRAALLGDIINASPLFVGKPAFKYTENGYQSFVTSNANRKAVVLAAANDGMLHAFDRSNGNELWAFVPSFVMGNLYKLADNSYANNHSYFVDGSPVLGDIYTGTAWKSIVVGGLNSGGRGYYALDVTNPASPKLLWEFKNDNLGLSYGNPIITKRNDGTWVVVFGSGYNNVSPGDGNGHLFVVNAATGAVIKDVPTFSTGTTAVGTTSNPSGLAKINGWVDSETVNLTKRYYGADLLGNLWRFDIDGLVEPNNSALLLAKLQDASGNVQPVTTQPLLADVNYNGSTFPVVYVATGRYLGTTDLANNTVQTVYAIKDPLTSSGYGVVRSDANFVTQTVTANGTARSSSNNAVDWTTKSGWRVDLPAGERVSVDPQLALTTLFVGSNLPSNDSCTVGGQSFLYQMDIATGKFVANYVGSVMIQGMTIVQFAQGASAGAIEVILTRSDGTLDPRPGTPNASSPSLRRTSWRELVE